jgi:hypothetical protein
MLPRGFLLNNFAFLMINLRYVSVLMLSLELWGHIFKRGKKNFYVLF